MRPVTLYTANCRGDKFNVLYPVKRVVRNLDDLVEAAAYDHVFAEYNGGHRSKEDFIRSDCLPFDCDNDHSDTESEWKTAADVERAFPGVPFYLVYSRHHLKWKGKRSPRPRFHVVFPIDSTTDAEAYRALKESVVAYFPYFDTGAKDAARFFFGVKNPKAELHGGDPDET